MINIREMYSHYVKNGGICHNKDGTVSDRLVWIMMYFSVQLFICLYWAFKEQPLPSYVRDLLMADIPIIMTLIGAQSYENVNDRNKEKN